MENEEALKILINHLEIKVREGNYGTYFLHCHNRFDDSTFVIQISKRQYEILEPLIKKYKG